MNTTNTTETPDISNAPTGELEFNIFIYVKNHANGKGGEIVTSTVHTDSEGYPIDPGIFLYQRGTIRKIRARCNARLNQQAEAPGGVYVKGKKQAPKPNAGRYSDWTLTLARNTLAFLGTVQPERKGGGAK